MTGETPLRSTLIDNSLDTSTELREKADETMESRYLYVLGGPADSRIASARKMGADNGGNVQKKRTGGSVPRPGREITQRLRFYGSWLMKPMTSFDQKILNDPPRIAVEPEGLTVMRMVSSFETLLGVRLSV